MANEKAVGVVGKSDVFKVDPRMIKINPDWNPRTNGNMGDMEGLKRFIVQNGVPSPIILKRTNAGELELVAGFRRLTGTLELIDEGHDIKSVPAFIRKRGYLNTEAMLEAIAENESQPFTPLELSDAYRRLKSWGWSQSEIARRSGKSKSYISYIMSLNDADPEVKEALISGEISLSDAAQIIRDGKTSEDPHGTQKKRIKKAKAEGPKLNYRFVKLLKSEVGIHFGGIDRLIDYMKSADDYSKNENDAFFAGRLSILAELSKKNADIGDIPEIIRD